MTQPRRSADVLTLRQVECEKPRWVLQLLCINCVGRVRALRVSHFLAIVPCEARFKRMHTCAGFVVWLFMFDLFILQDIRLIIERFAEFLCGALPKIMLADESEFLLKNLPKFHYLIDE